MKGRSRTYLSTLLALVIWTLAMPARSQAQGALPCPPVDVNRPDQFTSINAATPSFHFVTLTDFQNGLTDMTHLYINAKGGRNYEIRYRLMNGTAPILSASGTTLSATGAFQATASFGVAGWGTLNVQIPRSNVPLTTEWNTLATFKARCAVTRGDLLVDLKALGTIAGVKNFFVKGSTPPLDYGAMNVEFAIVQVDNNTQQDLRSQPYEILIGDVLDFSLNNSTTTITAAPFDYLNGIEVSVDGQISVTSNNAYDVNVSSDANTMSASGNGAMGTIDFSDISMRIASTTAGMGTLSTRNLNTSIQSIATGALGSIMNKLIGLTYRLQNNNPKNINPGTYAGTVYITVTEN